MNTLLLSFATSMTWLNVILLIAGVVIVLKGADWLTDGAVGIAEKMGIPQLVIGLTIVAMGTSMPELCVSLYLHSKIHQILPLVMWLVLIHLTHF